MSKYLAMALRVAAAVLLAGAATAEDEGTVASMEGLKVIEIRVVGNDRIPAERILGVVKTHAGDALSLQGLDEDTKAVYATGHFSNVAARTEPAEGGVRVILEVTERQVIVRMEVVGAKAIPRTDIEAATGLSVGAAADPFLISQATDKIQALYRGRGYPGASAEVTTSETPAGVTVEIAVSEGTRGRITKVTITGNRAFGSSKIRGLMQTKAKSLFVHKGIYEEAQLADDVSRVKRFYMDEGFFDARVASEVESNASGTRITVIVRIDEGARYTVREIGASGNAAIETEELLSKITVAPGDVARQQKLERDRSAILDAYGDLGYVEAEVTVQPTYDPEAHQVDLTFTVEEGAPLYVGKVDITGNTKTKDKVIRRDVTLSPGQLASRREMRASKERLEGRRFFDKVELSLVPGGAGETRDVQVAVEEGKTGLLTFGAGISSDSGIIGTASIAQRNFDITDRPKSWGDLFSGEAFTGGGQQFSLEISPGTELSQVSLAFREPHLFDSPFSFGINLYAREREREHYDEARAGGILSFGQTLRRDLYGEVSVRAESVNISNLGADVPADVLAVRGHNDIIVAGARLIQDTTNRYFMPTEGHRVSAEYEYATGDFSFQKVTLGATGYWTTHVNADGNKQVLTLRGETGIAWPYGETPIFERFYTGGAASLRGFEYRGVGPRAMGVPLGGDFLALAGVEYTVPLFVEALRGAVFADAGGVWENMGALDSGGIRCSVGVGLRFVLPVLGNVPVALDFAWPIASETGDKEQAFSFNIGAFF
ncbi:MAG: outer membrane protein assembly factor BamA [Planctomycetota bacterium]